MSRVTLVEEIEEAVDLERHEEEVEGFVDEEETNCHKDYFHIYEYR